MNDEYFPKKKATNLLDIPSYNNDYLTDSKIDLAFMDTFNISDKIGERMGSHNRNTVIEQHANDPIAKENYKNYRRDYSNLDRVVEKRRISQRTPEFREHHRIWMNEKNKRLRQLDEEEADEIFNNFLDNLEKD